MENTNGILVIGEISDGKLASVSREALACARNLAKQTQSIVGISILGNNLGTTPTEAIEYGADKVYIVDDSVLEDFQVEIHLSILENIIMDYNPKIIISTKTSIGRDLAPRLAFRLGTGLMQDCTDLWIDSDSGTLAGSRPVFGGNFIATIVGMGSIQVAAIREKVIEELEPDTKRKGEIINYPTKIKPSVAKTRLISRVKEKFEGIKLEEATIVVGGGRGLGGPEPFRQLEVLADLLGGAVGASRAACDHGWISAAHQVGLTGKTITPNLYITIGISGAIQHMAGCNRSKVIVAIDNDKRANIFDSARYGVVGDWNTILPGFIEEVRKLVEP
jgi:electron transfer flavoprotein alpha subunit